MGNVIAAAPPVPPPLPTALLVKEKPLDNPGTVQQYEDRRRQLRIGSKELSISS